MESDRQDDLFPGFESHTVETGSANLYCRTGGSGPPLLLLHGYPQSHVMWHTISPGLADRFHLVIPDLPGYGRSSIPPLSDDHAAYSKRSMALAVREMMHLLGHDRFMVAGHDRGGRVGYRLALDWPDTVKRLAVLDILPTSDYWDRLDRTFGIKIYHWMFLAQPAPFPEKVIGACPLRFLEHTLASWTADKSLKAFSEASLAHTRAWFCHPDRIAATCEDYRAGAGPDYLHDRADREAGRTGEMPFLALWGDEGIATSVDEPLEAWKNWFPNAEGAALPCGHFLPEEAPQETLELLLRFFGR